MFVRNGSRLEDEAKQDKLLSFLDFYSFGRNGGVIFPLKRAYLQWRNDRFSVFTVEPLHLFHVGISKNLKEGTVIFLLALNEKVVLTSMSRTRKHVSSCRTLLLYRFKNLLSAYHNEFAVSGLHVNFLCAHMLSQLNYFSLPLS